MAGTLNIEAGEKASRFVRFCDAFSIPIVTLVDVPGLPAGHRPGMDRRHPPRREAAVRLRRGDRAARDRDPAQGLRRRVHRDGLEAARRRHQPRLADGRDRGHGRPGRGQHPLPRRDQAGRGLPARMSRPCARASRTSTPTTSRRRSSPPSAASSTASSSPRRRASSIAKALRALRGKRAEPAAQEAREHPAVTDPPTPGGLESITIDVRRGTPTERGARRAHRRRQRGLRAEAAGAIAEEPGPPTAWALSQRSLREPLRRDLGWGRFGG